MTKWENIDAMADLVERKYGSLAAVAGYFKGMAASYIDDKDLDFHFERLVVDLQKDCGL